MTDEMRAKVFQSIAGKITDLGCEALAIGGVADHVHVLFRFTPAAAISRVVQEIKGSSSHLVNHDASAREARLKWQEGYGAFTISTRSLADVKEYVLNQEERHRTGRLVAPLEKTENDSSP